MKLYTYPPAPSPQRVALFMKVKNIELPIELVDMKTQAHMSESFKKVNPRMTLPTLVLEDGTVISEVVAICRYLEAYFPDYSPSLLGEEAKEQALICEWDHRIETELLLAIADALRNRGQGFKDRALPGALNLTQIPELVPRGLKRIEAFFAILDQQLSSNEHIAGQKFSVADITAFVAIKFSAWVKVEVSEQYVHLHRWFKQVSARLG
jgi:glutathione S-transferase